MNQDARNSCSFNDEELIAEEYPISIKPSFTTSEPLRFLSHECGPFDRRQTVTVPLWVALYLECHGKCTIVRPEWLSVEFFKKKIREEREATTSTMGTMPDSLFHVATRLLTRDNVPADFFGTDAARKEIESIVLELVLIRKAKIVESMKQIDVMTAVLDITNVTALERASTRQQSGEVMDSLRDLWTIRDTILVGESRGISMTIAEDFSTGPAQSCRPVPTESELKRLKRKKKLPINFRLNKVLVRAESTEEVLNVIGENIADFNIVNIGTALYRLALVCGSPTSFDRDALRIDKRFASLVNEIVDTLDGDSESDSLQHVVLAPKELSNIIWAATKLGLNDTVLFNAVAKHVICHMQHFDSVNLSLTLWGFAKMDMKAPDMFSAAKSRIKDLLQEFEPHRICNTVWAFAKTMNTDLDLFKAIAEESLRKLHRFNHSNESMLLYAYALGHVHAPLLFKRAMSQQLPAIQSGEIQDPRSLSNLLWAISELNLSNEYPQLYDAVASSAVANIHRYSLTHMATVGAAYAKANIRADTLFQLMASESVNRPIEDESQWSDLLVLQEAFSHFSIQAEKVNEIISRVTEERKVASVSTRKADMKVLVTDLLTTSTIAAVVLLIAAIVRMYLL